MSPIGSPSSRAQTHGGHVAEVAGRHDEVGLAPLAMPDLQARRGVVDHLRQQPADVDAVRRRELVRRRRARGSRNASLTMRWQSSNVPRTANVRTLSPQHASCCACRGETSPSRIQQHDVDPRPPMERRGDGAAGVAGRRDEDRDLAARASACTPFERGRQEARAEILERAGRPVKQLEHAGVGRARARAARAARESRTPRGRSRASSAASGSPAANGASSRSAIAGSAADRGKSVHDSAGSALRDEQPAVRRDALQDRVAQRDRRGPAARADESHRIRSTIVAPTGSIRVIHASLVMPSARNASTIAGADLVRLDLLRPREHRRARAGDRAAERAARHRGVLDRLEARDEALALRLDQHVFERRRDQRQIGGEAAGDESREVGLLPDDVGQRDGAAEDRPGAARLEDAVRTHEHGAHGRRHRDLLDVRIVDADRQHQAAVERRRDVVDVRRAARDQSRPASRTCSRRRLSSGSIEQRVGRDDGRDRGRRRAAQARAERNAFLDGQLEAEVETERLRHGGHRHAGRVPLELERQVRDDAGDRGDADAAGRRCARRGRGRRRTDAL